MITEIYKMNLLQQQFDKLIKVMDIRNAKKDETVRKADNIPDSDLLDKLKFFEFKSVDPSDHDKYQAVIPDRNQPTVDGNDNNKG